MSNQFLISRDGQQFGPYSIAELQQHIAAGMVSPEDQAWVGGEQKEWQPLRELVRAEVLGAATLTPPPPPPPPLVAQTSQALQPREEEHTKTKPPEKNERTILARLWRVTYLACGAFVGVIGCTLIYAITIDKYPDFEGYILWSGGGIVVFLLIYYAKKRASRCTRCEKDWAMIEQGTVIAESEQIEKTVKESIGQGSASTYVSRNRPFTREHLVTVFQCKYCGHELHVSSIREKQNKKGIFG